MSSYLRNKYPIKDVYNEYEQVIQILSNLPVTIHKSLPLENIPQLPTMKELLAIKQQLLTIYYEETQKKAELEKQCQNINDTINMSIKRRIEKMNEQLPYWSQEFNNYMNKLIESIEYSGMKKIDFTKSLKTDNVFTLATKQMEENQPKSKKRKFFW